MKVYFIYVRDDDFYHMLPDKLNRSRSDGLVKVMAFPPLGIQTLAPVLRQHGHEVRLFDTCHPEMKEEHIVRATAEGKPDLIALSFLSTTTYPPTKQMAKCLKTVAPDTPIIVGGAFATMNAANSLQDCPQIDCVGIGEGEELLPDYLNNLDDPGAVEGLCWRSGEEVILNPMRPLIQDLDRFPYPDRNSLPIEYIESMPLDVPAVLSLDRFCIMQTSRGCPFQCIYCDIPALGRGKWRCRSAENVLGEMQELNDAGYKSIYLTDDHFLMRRTRINAICQGIIDRKFEFHWGCEGRVDSVAMDEFPLMARSNCNFLAFGIEAGTQKVLDRLRKNQKLEQIEHAIDKAKKDGIATTHGFFLIGSPDETEEDILESFRFAAKLKLDTFGFNRLCVYRGTPLWHEYVNRGIIDDERDWNKWFKCSDIDPTILPGMVVHNARKKGYALLFAKRLTRRPIETLKLIRRFSRYMAFSDLIKLLWSPFRRNKTEYRPDLPARMIDAGLKEPIRTH